MLAGVDSASLCLSVLALWLLLMSALAHLRLICLVLCIRVIAVVWLAVVAGMTLRVAGVIGAILATGLAMLESALLGRPK